MKEVSSAVGRAPARTTDREDRTLMDRMRRLLRPMRLPMPPRPQDWAGLRGGGALPLVRWAHESAEQESNLPCQSASLGSRCRHTTANRGGIDARPRRGRPRDIDPIAGDLFNCQGTFGRDETDHLGK